MRLITVLYKGIRKLNHFFRKPFYTIYGKLLFIFNGISIPNKMNIRGVMKIIVTPRGAVIIGNNFNVNSGNNHNIIGRQQKTTFWVEGKLTIGNNVGMSATALICNHEIEIGNNVTIGGNTVIYDTDFHSLDSVTRANKKEDKKNAKWGKVTLSDNVFIGAHTTILKGVTIGKNSIIGACSLIGKDVPENEIWAGNPAQFIKKIS
jgi:acetyltransferase-like isoleucine patch superfamily enzyme